MSTPIAIIEAMIVVLVFVIAPLPPSGAALRRFVALHRRIRLTLPSCGAALGRRDPALGASVPSFGPSTAPLGRSVPVLCRSTPSLRPRVALLSCIHAG